MYQLCYQITLSPKYTIKCVWQIQFEHMFKFIKCIWSYFSLKFMRRYYFSIVANTILTYMTYTFDSVFRALKKVRGFKILQYCISELFYQSCYQITATLERKFVIIYTVESRYNEHRYNEHLAITNYTPFPFFFSNKTLINPLYITNLRYNVP